MEIKVFTILYSKYNGTLEAEHKDEYKSLCKGLLWKYKKIGV